MHKDKRTEPMRRLQSAAAAVGLVALAACGGGGGGDGGGSTPPVASPPTAPPVSPPVTTAPTITSQPQGATRVVGQAFSPAVAATGTELSYTWETSVDGGTRWTQVSGATGATLARAPVAMADSGSRWRVRVSNSAGSVTSESALLTTVWGEVVTSADTTRLELLHGGGDGGTDGGADGDGADGGGGLGKVLNARMTVTRVADGARVGSALTHPVTGLVRIKAGPGAGPFLLTLEGAAGATYYDEGKNTLLPFGPGHVLHALVDRIDENLAVSPLTEAAYRYAINHFVADPAQVRAGTSPLLSRASVATLTAAQIRQANEQVRLEINRLLPQQLQVPSVKSLPTPIDNTSATSVLSVSRYGLAAVVTGGLVRKANSYLPTATVPALELTEQLARDLTDGTINGFALDGTPASAAAVYYDVSRDGLELAAAGASVSKQFGSASTLPLSPGISDYAEGSTDAGPTFAEVCEERRDNVALVRDGKVNVQRVTAAPGQRCLRDGSVTQLLSAFVDDVRFVRSQASQVFVVKNDGSVSAWGEATCGKLGEGTASGRFDSPVPVPGLADITSLSSGSYHGIGRDKLGFVYTWGADVYGALGLGPSPAHDLASCNVLQFKGSVSNQAANLTPRRVPGLVNIVSVASGQLSSYALDTSGRVYEWGQVATSASAFDSRSVPTLVPGLSAVSAITSGGGMSFALKSDGSVWGWGSNINSNFGDGSSTPKITPQQVPGLSDIVQLAGDSQGGVAVLRRDGTVFVWGSRLFPMPTHATVLFSCRTAAGGFCAGDGTVGTLPKMRQISSNGFRIIMFGLDGKVYSFIASTNGLPIIHGPDLGAP